MSNLFENFDEIFEKKLDVRTPWLMEAVSWDEFCIPYRPWPGRVTLEDVPAWKVDLSGMLREKLRGVALALPEGESGGSLLKKSEDIHLTMMKEEKILLSQMCHQSFVRWSLLSNKQAACKIINFRRIIINKRTYHHLSLNNFNKK